MAAKKLISVSRRAVFLLAVSLSCLPLYAEAVTPFFSANQNPLLQVHDLPPIGSARILAKNQSRYRLVADHASLYTSISEADESLLLDGENSRITFAFAQGLSNGWEWGVQIPYLRHGPGELDSFIQDWHDLFGLPQGGRDTAPRNRLLYQYIRKGVTRFELSQASSGLGDIRIGAGRQWHIADNDTNIALRGMLGLPTGDAQQLRGSGNFDAAFWISADREQQWFGKQGLGKQSGLFGGVGVLLMAPGDVLPELQRRAAIFGSLGAGVQVSPRATLKLQADFHTALYSDSELSSISANAVQLAMGGEVRLGNKTFLDIGVIEDLTVNAAPDVVFQLGLTVRN